MAASADQPTLVLLHGLLGDANDWQPVQAALADLPSLALDLPVLVGAENATKLLKSGTTVTLDCQRGIVFSGTSHHLPRPNR